MSKRYYSGQILLVTVIVLMILAIIVVGVIGLANQDVRQTIAEQQYRQILNVSEVQLLDFVSKYGNAETGYNQLQQDEPQCIIHSPTEYECQLAPTIDNVETNMRIEDVDEVEDFELGKDESLELNLVSDPSTGKGFRGQIHFNYTGSIALEFNLYYKLNGNQYVISDIFDLTAGSVYDPIHGSSLDNSSPSHPFNFNKDIGTDDYLFLINSIDGLPGLAQPTSLRITARMKQSDIVTKLNVKATLGGLSLSTAGRFPDQMRKYTATSYFGGEDTAIATQVESQIPLLDQALSVLYGGILVDGDISK